MAYSLVKSRGISCGVNIWEPAIEWGAGGYGLESTSLRQLTKQVIDITYKTNKTDDLTVI
jgi:hypothetical protein